MASGTIATRTGTMLVPGMSLNKRLYTKELIGKAVKRMRERIDSPDGLPIVMRTHHDAGDNSALIVGKIIEATVSDNGVARYRSALYDTPEGRTLATLTDPRNPALRSTSIHGYWIGPVKRVSHDGTMAETADDLEIDAVDFTATPGVIQAVIDSGSGHASESMLRTPITETFTVLESPADNTVPGCDGTCCQDCGVNAGSDTTGESAAAEKGAPALKSGKPAAPQTKAKNYADPGYQDDQAKRYALDTKAQVRAAWSYVNMPKNASKYTAAQLAKVKARIKSAAKKFGIDISSDEAWLIDRWSETGESVSEFYGDDSARFCISVSNGPIEVTVSSYCIHPADLDVIARKAMDGACQALTGLDPDDDGDIDVPGMVGDSVAGETMITIDGNAWTTEQVIEAVRDHIKLRRGALTINEVRTELEQAPTEISPAETGGETKETQTEEGEPTVSEATDQAAETTGAPDDDRKLTDADAAAIGAAFAKAMTAHAPAIPAPAAQPAENAPVTPAATESTTKVDEVAALKEAVVGVLKEAVEGLTGHVTKQVSEQTGKLRDELREALVKAGVTPLRVGLASEAAKAGLPDAGPERSPDELFADRANVLLGGYARNPVPHASTGVAPWPTAAPTVPIAVPAP